MENNSEKVVSMLADAGGWDSQKGTMRPDSEIAELTTKLAGFLGVTDSDIVNRATDAYHKCWRGQRGMGGHMQWQDAYRKANLTEKWLG